MQRPCYYARWHSKQRRIPTIATSPAPSLPKAPWTLADASWALLQVVVVAAILLPVAGILHHLWPGNQGIVGFSTSLLLEGALVLTVAWYGPWRHRVPWSALGLTPAPASTGWLALAAFGGILGFSVVYTLVITALGADSLLPQGLPDELTKGLLQQVLGSATAIIAAPFAEELFFRGFLLPAFASQWGFVPGAVASSLLFAASHVSLGLLLPAFAAGLLLAWLYRRTSSLWPCVMAHGLQNTLALWSVLLNP